jgi:hypothetical protein
VRNVFAISVNCHTVPFFLKQIQQSKKEFSDTLLDELTKVYGLEALLGSAYGEEWTT